MITLLQPRALAPLTRVSAPGAPQTLLTVATPPAISLTSIGRRGPPGPKGDPGDGLFTLVTPLALGGHRLVATDGADGLRYADCTQPDDALALVGMSLHAADAGASLTLRRLGVIEESSWAWTPGLPVYLGHAGVPTQSLPGDAVISLVVGIPTTPTRLFLAPREPVFLVSA